MVKILQPIPNTWPSGPVFDGCGRHRIGKACNGHQGSCACEFHDPLVKAKAVKSTLAAISVKVVQAAAVSFSMPMVP